MDATTMRAVVAYIAELRRDRDYHRAIECSSHSGEKSSEDNRSQGYRSGDAGFTPDHTGQDRHNI
jgi:hypothetical protein